MHYQHLMKNLPLKAPPAPRPPDGPRGRRARRGRRAARHVVGSRGRWALGRAPARPPRPRPRLRGPRLGGAPPTRHRGSAGPADGASRVSGASWTGDNLRGV